MYTESLPLTLASHYPLGLDGTWMVPQIFKEGHWYLALSLKTANSNESRVFVFNHVLYYTPGLSSQDSSLEVNIRVRRREYSSPLRSSFHHEKITFGWLFKIDIQPTFGSHGAKVALISLHIHFSVGKTYFLERSEALNGIPETY